jgi:DNA repair protein SbcD/Mre11
MRILHIADVHLDRPFVDLGVADARARRAEVRETFRRALQIGAERNVDLITIGGDLWEDENVVADTRLSVARELKRAGVPVAIVAGNHDPLIPGGNYPQTPWPDNVRVFTSVPEELAVGPVSIWGVSWTSDRLSAHFLDSFHVPDDGRSHLLLIHGTAVTNPHFADTSSHCPFDPARAAAAGFDAVLCGHIHAASWADGVIYPGSPEPLGWSEVARHCVAIVEIADTGTPDVELVDINQRQYASVVVGCSGCDSSAEILERIQQAINDLPDPQRLCLKLELRGRVGTAAVIDPGQIHGQFAARFDLVRVVNHATRAWDLDALMEQPTADGRFVATLVERRDRADDPRDRKVVELALEAGLSAMRGDGPILHVD